jgi:hypothetical protein
MVTRTKARDAATAVKDRGVDAAKQTRQLVTQQPAVIDLAAVAAGAAVGLAVPATKPERELVAQRRKQVIETLDSAGAQTVEKVRRAVEA